MRTTTYPDTVSRENMILNAFGIADTDAGDAHGPVEQSPESPRFARLARVAASLWFIMLGSILARSLVDAVHAVPPGSAGLVAWASVVSRCCTLAFFATLGWLMLVRPHPIARRKELLPAVIAFAGTYAVWLMPLMPRAQISPTLQIVSAAVTLAGSLSIIFAVLHLGRSFSIVPQARKLVIGGPYRFVRHPLYAAEELAIVGILFQYAWQAALLFLVVHLALQIRRMNYEESLLRAVFPDYEAYARRTARLIPGVW